MQRVLLEKHNAAEHCIATATFVSWIFSMSHDRSMDRALIARRFLERMKASVKAVLSKLLAAILLENVCGHLWRCLEYESCTQAMLQVEVRHCPHPM
jgi:hypothetical protein